MSSTNDAATNNDAATSNGAAGDSATASAPTAVTTVAATTSAMTQALDATRITPSLTVSDIERSLGFYTDGLGFEVANRHDDDEGALVFCELKAGTTRLGIAQDDWAKGRDRVKGVGMRLFITTSQDIKALAQRAKAAGITLDQEAEPLPWGPLAFAVTDPDGFKLTISSSE